MDRQSYDLKDPIYIHPIEEPAISDLNDNSKNIADAIKNIDNTIIAGAKKFEHLILNTKLKLENIKEQLLAEKERLQDINFLCNKHTEFSSVLSLAKEDFEGNLTFEDGILKAVVVGSNRVPCRTERVEGNGYEGNQYVYLNGEFLNKTLDTSNRKYITDSNLATAFEYSRITTSSDNEGLPILFNKDSIDAQCSIDLSAESLVNEIYIKSERNDLVLKAIYLSDDGLIYKLDKEYDIEINNTNEKYNNQDYIYGSGLISITPSKHIKVVLKSNGYSNDKVAFERVFNSGEDNTTKIEIINSAKRHVIRANGISTGRTTYSRGVVLSKELITEPVTRIGLFCNEYINPKYTVDNNIIYFLIINGVEHKIVPMNCHRNEKKIIRTSSNDYKSDHAIYITEEIKSARLKIVVTPTNEDITPYISNLKIMIGGDE